jgi:hypothetical protein
MSDKALALLTIAIVATPWAVVTCVALIRGYNVKAWKPTRREDDDDAADR